jgi:hypothetical protein
MKGVVGLVSLLVALAAVGLLAARQLGGKSPASASAAASAAGVPEARTPAQGRQVQEQVRSDVVKALEQGARREENNP